MLTIKIKGFCLQYNSVKYFNDGLSKTTDQLNVLINFIKFDVLPQPQLRTWRCF